MGTDGTYDTAYGTDGIFKISDNDYFNVNWVQVMDKISPNSVYILSRLLSHFSDYLYNLHF